jgi:hypothetical protein
MSLERILLHYLPAEKRENQHKKSFSPLLLSEFFFLNKFTHLLNLRSVQTQRPRRNFQVTSACHFSFFSDIVGYQSSLIILKIIITSRSKVLREKMFIICNPTLCLVVLLMINQTIGKQRSILFYIINYDFVWN